MAKFKYKEQRAINSLSAFNTKLDKHIGKKVRFTNPTCLAEKEEYEIRHIQKDYSGELAYNLIGTTEDHMGKGWIGSDSHQLGKCANPKEVYFVDSKQKK